MKKTVILIITTIFFFQCEQNSITISENKVGNIKIGYPLHKVKKKLKTCEFKEINKNDRNMYYDYFDIYENGEKILSLRFNDNILDGIHVLSNKFMTNKGICKGITAQEVTDKGYRITHLQMKDDGIHAYPFNEKFIIVYNKRITTNEKISKYAVIKKIIVGEEFLSEKENQNIDFSTINNNL